MTPAVRIALGVALTPLALVLMLSLIRFVVWVGVVWLAILGLI